MIKKQARDYIGITRNLDQLGRVVIPVEFRRELGIELGDELEIKLVQLNKKDKVIEITKKGN